MRVNHCNMQHATCKEGNPNKTKERKDKKKGLSALVSLVSLLIDNFDMLAKDFGLRRR
jgi:hypothetical protein